jgi:shikimate kinase
MSLPASRIMGSVKSQDPLRSAASDGGREPAEDDPAPGPIWLVGMMGVGKSTVGPMLAKLLRRPFVDTDSEIEREAGRKVAEIFAEQGEAAFRGLERQAIERVSKSNAVVALGGGAVAAPGATQRLRELGTVVYLEATPELLVGRIGNPDSRPLLAGLDEQQRCERLRGLLEERRAAYEQATLILDMATVSLEGAAPEIAQKLEREGMSE